MKNCDLLITGLNSAALFPDHYRGKGTKPSWKVEELKDAAIAVSEGKILWIGPSLEADKNVSVSSETKIYNGKGLTAVPGFVDSHTHLVYGGSRSEEFEMRVKGKTYLEIMSAGGGILNTTEAVRSMSEDELAEVTLSRLNEALSCGASTVEIKSGYGLDLENELKLLRVINKVKNISPVRVIPTFMGAHAIPSAWSNDPDGFTSEICNKWIPAVAESGLAVFNDVFTETGAFNVEQSRRILKTGLKYGLLPKIHADEINVIGGVDLAAEVGAVSADHLLITGDEGIETLKGSGVIPTLLPGTSTFLMEAHHAPGRKMIDAGLPVAIASDHNPGSCQFLSSLIIQTLAMLQLRMTSSEALIAGTLHSAYAVGMGDKTGSLEPGKYADITLIKADSFKDIGYKAGSSQLVYDVIISGKSVLKRSI